MTALETELEAASAAILRESCMPVLETERLVLRVPRFEDVPAVVALANDRRIAEMTANLPHPYAAKDAENWIANAWTSQDHPLLITPQGQRRAHRCDGLRDARHRRSRNRLLARHAHWGRGYATEAARAVVDHLFTDRAAEAVAARAGSSIRPRAGHRALRLPSGSAPASPARACWRARCRSTSSASTARSGPASSLARPDPAALRAEGRRGLPGVSLVLQPPAGTTGGVRGRTG